MMVCNCLNGGHRMKGYNYNEFETSATSFYKREYLRQVNLLGSYQSLNNLSTYHDNNDSQTELYFCQFVSNLFSVIIFLTHTWKQ